MLHFWVLVIKRRTSDFSDFSDFSFTIYNMEIIHSMSTPTCFDCGPFNQLGISGEKCCPIPANFPSPLDTSCCQYQYKKPGLIVCYKKTKYNTPYHVSGAQGPAKFRLMPHNYTGQKLRQTRIQRGRWNHGLSNTKLFPVISECRDTSGNLISTIQSKNI